MQKSDEDEDADADDEEDSRYVMPRFAVGERSLMIDGPDPDT